MRISDYLAMTKDTMSAYSRMCEPVLLKYDKNVVPGVVKEYLDKEGK